MDKEITTVYRIRNKKTGEFLSGGHSAQQGIFIAIKGAVASFRRLTFYDGKTPWLKYLGYAQDYEIVEFYLTEVDTHPIPEKGK